METTSLVNIKSINTKITQREVDGNIFPPSIYCFRLPIWHHTTFLVTNKQVAESTIFPYPYYL